VKRLGCRLGVSGVRPRTGGLDEGQILPGQKNLFFGGEEDLMPIR